MPSDFTVVQSVRQEFGNGLANEFPLEQPVLKAGLAKNFPFACPGVDSGQEGVLQFETLGVSAGRFLRDRNVLRINGFDVPGAITPGPLQPRSDNTTGERIWKSHCLTIPANILRTQNVLRIEAIELVSGPIRVPDRFLVDNIVVFFKTRNTPTPGTGGTTNPGAVATRTSKARVAKKAPPARKAKARKAIRAKSPAKRSK